MNELLVSVKGHHCNETIQQCPDQKSLFKILNQLLLRNVAPKLPEHDSVSELAGRFLHYFESKIGKIRTLLDDLPPVTTSFPSDSFAAPPLSSLCNLSPDDVVKLITSAPSKSCPLDPIPTWLLKDMLDVLAIPLSQIVSTSLQSGNVPHKLKQAFVTPLHKKPSLDPDNIKSYRPVSNLSFISKLVERAVDSQVSKHIETNNLMALTQSAYHPMHSVETALRKVQNDILWEMDQSNGVLLVLLDLSAAFDTIDHQTLLLRLQSFGIQDTVLRWHRSYLQDRTQKICINGVESDPITLKYGVPQGSVIGPKNFTMYTKPVYNIALQNKVSIHIYADDTQLYTSFNVNDPNDLMVALQRMEKCVSDIALWMQLNKLKLNEDKTEFVLICHPRNRHKIPPVMIHIGKETIPSSTSVRNLGATFDHGMRMSSHVTSTCQAMNFHLRNIGRIRKYLDTDSTEKIIHALVT